VEEYDLLIPDHAFDSPLVRRMLDVLQSDAFREKLEQMGGYTLDRPGEIIPYLDDEAL
jgi:putative molybdopterin biosynthesis protein